MTIFYVKDQKEARDFYEQLLGKAPSLDVPGMTEFTLSETSSLGLMPETGIKKLLKDLPDPEKNTGAKAELYLFTNQAEEMINKGIEAGATLLSPLSKRDWGDTVGYILDQDQYVLAIALERS